MTNLLFSNAAFLTGLTALVIPVLIHLLLKQKKQRFKFSTVQFFKTPDARSKKRKKVSNWLLLAARLLLLALLVTAFARPYLPRIPSMGSEPPHKRIVFVLDRSASMQAKEKNGTRWEQALNFIRTKLSELGEADHVALVTCGTPQVQTTALASPEQLLRELNKLEPGFGSGDLSEGLRAAVTVLGGDPDRTTSSIYVISDLQRTCCEHLSVSPVPEGLVQSAGCGEIELDNFAVTAVQYDAAAQHPLTATVSSFSGHDAQAIKLELFVDEKSNFSLSFDLAAGARTNISFATPLLSEGWHSTMARINSRDAFELDDIQFHTFYIAPRLRVLCVENRHGKRISEQASFFLASALNPFPEMTNQTRPDFKVETCSPDALSDALIQASPPAVVVLPALREIPAGWGKALSQFTRNGGGLLLFTGEEIIASRYNDEFRELAPARLGGPEGDPSHAEDFWQLEVIQMSQEPFSVFGKPNSGDLSLPEFKRRVALAPIDASNVLARFNDGVPIMLARNSGRGRVVLMNTSIDTSWTDWPKHKTYVPMIHSLAKYLAAGSRGDPSPKSATIALESGNRIETGTRAKTQFRLISPSGKEELVFSDKKGQVDLSVGRPGLYSLRDVEGRETARMAANVPQSESDLLAYTASEFGSMLTHRPTIGTTKKFSSASHENQNEPSFWRILMMSALILLVLEPLFANRTFA